MTALSASACAPSRVTPTRLEHFLLDLSRLLETSTLRRMDRRAGVDSAKAGGPASTRAIEQRRTAQSLAHLGILPR